jgi:hypothetical protein
MYLKAVLLLAAINNSGQYLWPHSQSCIYDVPTVFRSSNSEIEYQLGCGPTNVYAVSRHVCTSAERLLRYLYPSRSFSTVTCFLWPLKEFELILVFLDCRKKNIQSFQFSLKSSKRTYGSNTKARVFVCPPLHPVHYCTWENNEVFIALKRCFKLTSVCWQQRLSSLIVLRVSYIFRFSPVC